MKTLDRYLTVFFVKNFLLALFSLILLFQFQAMFTDILARVYPTNQVIIFHLLRVPDILVLMTGPAVLLGTVLTLSGLSRSNELIACFSIGVSLRRITFLVLSVVFIISCMVLIFEDRILPPTYKKRTTYEMRVMKGRQDFFLDIKQDKIWYRSKNLIYNLQRFDSRSKSIIGMSVYSFDPDFNLLQVVDASRAEYSPSGWRLLNGTVTTFAKDDPYPKTLPFTEKDLQIEETPHDFQEIDKEVAGLRLRELYRYIQRMRNTGADTKSFEVQFHSRISLSFIPIVMCILGVPFSTRTRREGGAAKDLGVCLGVTFFYWLFYSVGLSLGTNGALPPWLAAWLPSTIFAAVAVALIARRK